MLATVSVVLNILPSCSYQLRAHECGFEASKAKERTWRMQSPGVMTAIRELAQVWHGFIVLLLLLFPVVLISYCIRLAY
jgi:hypothetical protein